MLRDMFAAIARMEKKLNGLIDALAEEQEETSAYTLDGAPLPRERDETQSL